MTTITIPKKLAEAGDLILIPRAEYERLVKTAQPKRPAKQSALDKSLEKAIEEVRAGKTYGPFASVKELRRSLESQKSQKHS